MSNGQELPVGTGWDTPISSKFDDSEASGQNVSDPPSVGEEGEVAEAVEGREAVAGYQPPVVEIAAAAAAAPEALEAAQEAPLRDIGEASFGPRLVPESVIGTVDSRRQINATAAYPWRVHTSLRITAADDSLWVGTAWFVGPRCLITAGHVVYIKGSAVPGRDGWVKQIEVIPGRNGSDRPFGAVTTDNLRTVTGWAQNRDEEYDYGAILISEDLGDATGWFAYGVFSDDDLGSATANVSGYPADKPTGTQWYDYRQVDRVAARKVYYALDTYGGQSGSAVYRFVNGSRYAVGIHAYGGITANSGTRINEPVFNNIRAWEAQS